MTRSTVFPGTSRRRGNPDWGHPPQRPPALPTEFETQVKRIGLTKQEYVTSAELKRWCERNRNRVYVPEWLLEAWAMSVESTLSGVA
jgi:hypothetical protein